MRLCIHINGKDVEDDLLFFKKPVTLWLRLEPGYDAELPQGTFSVDGRPVANPFPHHEIGKPGAYEIKFASNIEAAANDESASAFQISRKVTFVRREGVAFLALTALLAALLWILMIWKLGIVFENGNREIKSLWSLDTLLPGTALIAATLAASLGLSQERIRTWFCGRHRFGTFVASLLGVFAFVLQATCFHAVTNATRETVSPFRVATSLEPESTTLAFPLLLEPRIETPFKPCESGADCQTLDASFSSLLLRFPSSGTTVVQCERAGIQGFFLKELQGEKSCTPDPERLITRTPSGMPGDGHSSEVSGDDSGVRYELRPFAPSLEQSFATLSKSLVRVRNQPDQATSISELALEGRDLVQRVHVPWRGARSGGTIAYAPWPADTPSLASGRVLSGASLIGRLACAFPGKGARLGIEFTPSRANLRRISVERLAQGTLDNGDFHQSYDIERPELVTHVPWCDSWHAGTGDGDPRHYAVHLHFEDSWTPENWSVALPARVMSLHVHGKNLAGDGRLSLRKGTHAPQRVEFVAYEIAADVRVLQGEHYVWESYDSRNRQRSTVWALKEDDVFQVELWSGDKRKTSRSSGFKLEALPLRRCIINKRTDTEQKTIGSTCKRKGLAEWLANFPHPDCSPTTSLLCQP